jgi:DNA recombination protein RmuC
MESLLASLSSAVRDALALGSETGAAGSPLGLLGLALLCVAAGALLAGVAARGWRRGDPREAFQALAAEALRQNNEGFLALASERLRAAHERQSLELAGRHEAIENLVAPLRQALEGYRHEARELDRRRASEAGELGERLRDLAHQTGELSSALRRSPGARGRWGELTLRRTVELAGLCEHCDFAEQITLGAGSGAARPDLVVRMPSGRQIAVDAKAPLDAYLDAAGADSAEDREAAVHRHARQVRRHVDALAARGYARQLEGTPEFVVLFLPHEGFLAAAVESERGLVADALAKGVVIATPATLYALLLAVAQGWREQQLADNTQRVLALAGEMDDRLGVLVGHLASLGGALDQSVRHFNATVGSFETRVLAQARRLRELGVSGTRDLDAAQPLATALRDVRGGA